MTTQADDAPGMRVEGYADLLIVLLYAPDRDGTPAQPIIGTTRLQKLMFLLSQGEGPRDLVQAAKGLGFEPFKMGPFSPDLRSAVEDLTAAGIIRVSSLTHVIPDDADAHVRSRFDRGKIVSYSYGLTSPLGVRVGNDLWHTLPTQVQKGFQEFKSFFSALSLRQLLIFTYEKFPKYTEQSTIKRQLGL